jgi:delta 1-pyrroline-5-carboxylate dehydrogenase
VNGKRVAGTSGRSGDVFNPATGATTGRVAFATIAEVGAAVAAAAKAFPEWADRPASRRATIMFKFRELLLRDADRLAGTITAEHGKTFSDAQGELARGIEVVEFVCGIPHLLKGEMTEQVSTGFGMFDCSRCGRAIRPVSVARGHHGAAIGADQLQPAGRFTCISSALVFHVAPAMLARADAGAQA